MSSRRHVRFTFSVWLFLLLGGMAVAQPYPSLERGFKPEKLYQLGDLDSVNLLNGNLVVRIPIGLSYTVGGSLSYSLALVYNSKVWDFQEVVANGQTFNQAMPDRLSNGGMGWSLSLGRLLQPAHSLNDLPAGNWEYIDSNGAQHQFYPGLHAIGQLGVDPCTSVCFSRDGSYIRMSTVGNQKVVELPDGTRQYFDEFPLPNNRTEWRLTSVRDRFDAPPPNPPELLIAYSADANTWTLKDKHGRMQTVVFGPDPAGRFERLLQRIDLTRFGDQSTPASYFFSYLPPQTVGVPCSANRLPGWDGGQVSLLSSVFLPDGTTWGLQYYSGSAFSGTCHAIGVLSDVFLPTRGKLHYFYRQWDLPIKACSFRQWLSSTAGVATRQFLDAAGNDAGTWAYTSVLSQPPPPGTLLFCDDNHRVPFRPASEELQVTVTTPLLDKTVHYFSVWPGAEFPVTTSFDEQDYGLPFSKLPAPDSTGTRFVSTQAFDCDAGGSNCALKRSAFVRYDRDAASRCDATTGPGTDCLDTNRRLAGERTVYHDDAGTFADADSSDFDGFGHYRTVATNGNFQGGNQRTTFTNYNPGNVLPGSAWVPNTYTEQTVTEGAATSKFQTCFDPSTGFLLRQRIYRSGTAPSNSDVVLVNAPDSSGNTSRQEWFGGDAASQALSTSTALCGLPLPASAYRLDNTYQFGTLRTFQYTDAAGNASGSLGFRQVDYDIDFNTGLVAASRDTAGIATDYTYDALGRLLTVKPRGTGEAWEEYTYVNATSFNRPRVEVRRCSPANTFGCTPLAQAQTEFDDLGRSSKQRQLMADGTMSKRVTTYDLAGNRSSISELQPDTASDFFLAKTTFSGFDPFGRPGTITPPDGPGHAVTIAHSGIRVETRTVTVGAGAPDASGNIPESPVTTTQVFDRQGRLLQVIEPSSPAGGLVTTEYGYDVGNRLSSVRTTAPEGTQQRFFTYDDRGFLKTETHPEKANVQVRYSDYDPMGHAGRIEDPVGGTNDLKFFYDRAGRLIEVWESGGRLLKQLTFAGPGSPCGFCNGKLQQALRNNYVKLGTDSFTIAIAENYFYNGLGGRISGRDTTNTVNGNTVETFTQGFDYGSLGEVQSLQYPRCTNAECAQVKPAVFQDVPIGHPDRLEIEAIKRVGITAGCDATHYCPDKAISRAEMSVFLLVAKEGPGYMPPVCTTPMFLDVPCSNPFAPWINELARRGITAGCGGGNFCPGNTVTNNEMSVFVVFTLVPGIQPPSSCAPFNDVPCSSGFSRWIAEEAKRGIMLGCGGGNFCPTANTTRGKMAGMLVRAFDIAVTLDANTRRTVQYAYTHGFLTAVPGYANSIDYHPNGVPHLVAHANGVSDITSVDPGTWLARPVAINTLGAQTDWNTGLYVYDGAGNITKMGTDWFRYDRVSRLVRGAVHDGQGGGNEKQQAYTFDTYGNILQIATTAAGSTQTRATPTDPATNRLTGGAFYDPAGNLTTWNLATYEYDKLNKLWHMKNGGEEWIYLYTAADERIWSYKADGTHSRWTLRDLDGKVLREYTNNSGNWSLTADYVYRDDNLLAAETNLGQRHYHLDHLGTPRLITNFVGYKKAFHVYYPFGEEATAFNQDTERMKFTGHERDLASLAGTGDDLDYMHARFCSPLTGRFLSTDPSPQARDSKAPQSWNSYFYTLGNPLKYVDPKGTVKLCPQLTGCSELQEPQTFWQWLKRAFHESSMLPIGPMALETGGATLLEELAQGGEVVAQGSKAVAPSSRALAKALEAEGEVREAGEHVHHLVAGGAKAAAPARKVLQRLGIGIDEAENGVFLPANKSTPNPAGKAVHSIIHTKAYYEAVNLFLEDVKTSGEALGILATIRQALLSGGFP